MTVKTTDTKLDTDIDPDTDTPDTDTRDVRTPDTDDEHRTDTPAPRRALPSFGLSGIQLVGTALAAITATVAASFLGVTGTVIGAALASVVTAIGNAVYTTSLRTTRDRVRDAVPLPARTTRSLPVVDDAPPVLPSPRPRPRRPRPGPSATRVWKRAAVASLGLFVVLMAIVTSVELLAGRPISDVLRGDSGGGTSFFGHDTVTTKTVPPTAPTVYVTVTPKIVVTTPTVTQTAPATTVTTPAPAASASASASPTGTASSTPTAGPTAATSPTPSAARTASGTSTP